MRKIPHPRPRRRRKTKSAQIQTTKLKNRHRTEPSRGETTNLRKSRDASQSAATKPARRRSSLVIAAASSPLLPSSACVPVYSDCDNDDSISLCTNIHEPLSAHPSHPSHPFDAEKVEKFFPKSINQSNTFSPHFAPRLHRHARPR